MEKRIYRHPVNTFDLISKPVGYLEKLQEEFVKASKEDFIKEYNIDPETVSIKSSIEKDIPGMITYIYVDIRGEKDAKWVSVYH